MKRVKIPLVSAKETISPNGSNVPEPVEEDRRHLVEAAIVRIMKVQFTRHLVSCKVTFGFEGSQDPPAQRSYR